MKSPYILAVGLLAVAAAAQEAPVAADTVETVKDASIGLEKVLIEGARKPQTSEYVAKTPLKRLENPQVYNTVNARTLEERGVTNFDDAMKSVPGVAKLWEATGRSNDGGTYFSLRGFAAQPSLVNGLPGLTTGGLDPANVERIEVLKGPSGTLFGSTVVAYGGAINTVTKKPLRQNATSVSVTTGSFDLNRTVVDVNRVLDTEGNVRARLVTAAHNEGSFQDAGYRKSLLIAPSIAYDATDRLSFSTSLEYFSIEGSYAPMLFLNRSRPVDFADISDLNYDTRRSLTSNDLSIKNPRMIAQSQMNYRINDTWTSQTVLSRGVSVSDGYYSYLWNAYPRKFVFYVSDQNSRTLSTDIQQNFLGDFNLFGMRHRALVGFDYFRRNLVDNSSGWVGVHNVDGQGNITNVNPADTQPGRTLSRQVVDNLISAATSSKSNSTSEIYSAYASDVINVTPDLAVMLSIRADKFMSSGEKLVRGDDYEQVAYSPKAGIVYQVIPDGLSLFANYMNGFKNVAPKVVSDSDGTNSRLKNFEAEQANQGEVGFKTNLLDGRLATTVSTYYIRVSNQVMTDPTNPKNSIQGGEVESKGLELDANLDLLPGLNIIAGYSFNHNEVLKNAPNNVFASVGYRLVEAGPEHMGNLWATYRFQEGTLRGFGAGVGGNAASRTAVLDNPVTGSFFLPSYVVYGASLFYERDGFSATLAVDNLTNVEYFAGYSTINPQKPRNIAASIGYRF